MDHGFEEINVFMPIMGAVVVLSLVSLGAFVMSYLIQYRVITTNLAPPSMRLLKGFGVFGVGLMLVIGLALVVLKLYAPY